MIVIIKKFTVSLICLFAISGCATNLVPVKYDSIAKVKSELDVKVSMNTGKVTGYSSSTMVYAGGLFIPVNSGPHPKLQFGSEDQKVFLSSLKSELKRLGIIGSISEQVNEGGFHAVVNFVQTEHFPGMQQYKLTVLLILKSKDKGYNKSYEILSSDGDSIWTKLNTDAKGGKKKAATKLLAAMIPDIEAFVKEISL